MKKNLFIILVLLPLISWGQTYRYGSWGFGSGVVGFQGGMVAIAVPVYNDSALALFDRFSQSPSPDLKAAISQWYDTIQYYNIGDSIDSRHVFAIHNQTDALLDWFRPTSASLINSPTWAQYQGFTTNGSNSYVRLNYNPGTDGIHYTLNYNHVGIYIRTNDFSVSTLGVFDAVSRFNLGVNATNWLIQDNTTASFALAHGSDITGASLVVRDDVSVKLFRNSSFINGGGIGVISVPNQALGMFVGALNRDGTANNFNANEYSIVNIGGMLSNLQAEKLQEADERYMDSFNTGVDPLAALPTLTPEMNVFALQSAIGSGDTTINLDVAGTYLFDDSIFLYDSTTIVWGTNTAMEMSQAYNPVYMNEGALTSTKNYNIELDGLKLVTNEYTETDTLIWGGRGHLTFDNISDLRIKDIECTDLGVYNFFFHINRWENVLIDGALVQGQKDCFHFHSGHDAIVRDVVAGTFDDLIFLGSTDYSKIQMDYLGDIYNMQFINLRDENINGNAGYQSRIFLASWLDWNNGNTYQTADMCHNAGNIYQLDESAGFSGIGTDAPVHTSGSSEGADGLNWKWKDNGTFYNTDIYNISFDSCTYIKDRTYAAGFEFVDDAFLRNIYPGSEGLAFADSFSYSNCSILYNSPEDFLNAGTNLKNLNLQNNYFDSINALVRSIVGEQSGDTLIIVAENNYINFLDEYLIRSQTDTRYMFYESHTDLTAMDSLKIGGVNVGTGGEARIISHTIPVWPLDGITPEISDTVLNSNGLNIWNGATWDLIP